MFDEATRGGGGGGRGKRLSLFLFLMQLSLVLTTTTVLLFTVRTFEASCAAAADHSRSVKEAERYTYATLGRRIRRPKRVLRRERKKETERSLHVGRGSIYAGFYYVRTQDFFSSPLVFLLLFCPSEGLSLFLFTSMCQAVEVA